ncbi:MAG: lyase [Pseudomonadota bacterium]
MRRGEGYCPESDWLMHAVRSQMDFEHGPDAAANLARLIALTRDAEASNRDWALLVLQQTALDTEDVRAALVAGLDDPDREARLEALIGVAKREPGRALPLVAALLAEDEIDSMTFEAAAYVADRALLPALEAVREGIEDEDDLFDDLLAEAMACCAIQVAPDWR